MEESLPQEWWQLAIGLGALLVLAVIADWLKSRVLNNAIGRVASEAEIALDKSLFDKNVLGRLAPIVPALVVYYGIVPALGVTRAEAEAGLEPGYLILFWTAVRRLTAAYIVLTLARTVSAFVGAFHHIYMRAYSESIAKPDQGLRAGRDPGHLHGCRSADRRHAAGPFAPGLSVRDRSSRGGADGRVPQHPGLVRREHPDHLQRHPAHRGLGGGPAGERERDRRRHRPAHGQGAELGQDDLDDSDPEIGR